MNRNWMPLYIADYLKKTAHLRAIESGAYLHLIMSYWVSGKLPTDDRQLATIAKMTSREWKSARETLASFFGPGWTHKRIDEELAKADAIAASSSDKARQAANARWSKDAPSKAPSNAKSINQAMPQNAPLPSPSDEDKDYGREPLISEASNLLADEIATIVGHDLKFVPPSWCGASWEVQKWLTAGWPREIILASVREQMQRRKGDPPNRIRYFEPGIVAAIARHQAPLPKAKIIEGDTVNVVSAHGNSLSAFARGKAFDADQFARGHGFRDEGGGSALRIVSEREGS